MAGTSENPAGTATAIGRGVDEFVSGVRDQAYDLKSQAQTLKKRYVDDNWANTREYIRDNPGKSLLLAAAAGLVVGTLIRRR